MKYKTQNGWTKEKMIEHVQKEFKGKSESSYMGCLYRGPNGKKCAMGMFIPDSEYCEAMESGDSNAKRVLNIFPNLRNYMPLDDEGMLEIQHRHDLAKNDACLDAIIGFINIQVENGDSN